MAETAGFDFMIKDQFEGYHTNFEEGCTGVFSGNRYSRAKRVVGPRWVYDISDKHLKDVRVVAVNVLGVCEEEEMVLGPSAGEPR